MKRQNLYKRDKNFDKESLVADFINIDWDSVLSIDQANPIISFDNYIKKTNEIIDVNNATESDILVPNITLLNTSLPSSSVPKGFSPDGFFKSSL